MEPDSRYSYSRSPPRLQKALFAKEKVHSCNIGCDNDTLAHQHNTGIISVTRDHINSILKTHLIS